MAEPGSQLWVKDGIVTEQGEVEEGIDPTVLDGVKVCQGYRRYGCGRKICTWTLLCEWLG